MRVEGQRADGVLRVNVGGGQFVLLNVERKQFSKPIDGSEIISHGPWGMTTANEAVVRRALATGRQVGVLALGNPYHGDGGKFDSADGNGGGPKAGSAFMKAARKSGREEAQFNKAEHVKAAVKVIAGHLKRAGYVEDKDSPQGSPRTVGGQRLKFTHATQTAEGPFGGKIARWAHVVHAHGPAGGRVSVTFGPTPPDAKK